MYFGWYNIQTTTMENDYLQVLGTVFFWEYLLMMRAQALERNGLNY